MESVIPTQTLLLAQSLKTLEQKSFMSDGVEGVVFVDIYEELKEFVYCHCVPFLCPLNSIDWAGDYCLSFLNPPWQISWKAFLCAGHGWVPLLPGALCDWKGGGDPMQPPWGADWVLTQGVEKNEVIKCQTRRESRSRSWGNPDMQLSLSQS